MRYIFPASQVIKTKVIISSDMESINSHSGTPNGIRAIITTGEVNGIIENQKAVGDCGFWIIKMEII